MRNRDFVQRAAQQGVRWGYGAVIVREEGSHHCVAVPRKRDRDEAGDRVQRKDAAGHVP